jgi:hypothetical protein
MPFCAPPADQTEGIVSIQIGGYASSHDCRVNCGLRSADRGGRRSRSRGVQRLGRATDRRPLPARELMDDYAQFAQTCRDSASGIVDVCGPGSPDSHRVVWGLTSRPPVPPAGFPPVSRLPAGLSPFARLPLVSLRPAFSGSSPSAAARFRFPFGVPPGSRPWSNLHDSAAAGRFRRRWSRAARTKVTSPAAIPRLDLAVIRPALQMGSGWARWMLRQNRLLRAAARAGHRRARTAQTTVRDALSRLAQRRAASGGGAGGPGRCGMVILVGWRARQEGPGSRRPGRPGKGCRGIPPPR